MVFACCSSALFARYLSPESSPYIYALVPALLVETSGIQLTDLKEAYVIKLSCISPFLLLEQKYCLYLWHEFQDGSILHLECKS